MFSDSWTHRTACSISPSIVSLARQPALALIGLVSLFAWGCGQSDEDTGHRDAALDAGWEDSDADATVTPDGAQDAEAQADADSDLCQSPTDEDPGQPNPAQGQTGHTEVAHWRADRFAALTISFDDSTPGQAQLGVPAMIERGFTGTWFVNPGTDHFLAHASVWEQLAPQNGQELANHTMHHSGAQNYAEAEAEIRDAAQVIWAAYPPDRSPLMGFNNGGGTDWNITQEQYESLLEQYHCVERLHSTGIPSGTLAEDLFPMIRDRLMLEPSQGGWADRWGLIHFHGLCDAASDTTGHCICTSDERCEEYGEGVLSAAVEFEQFTQFLDGFVEDPWASQNVWIGGFIEVYKYQQLRNDASFRIIQVGPNEMGVRMVSALDPALFDEPVTLLTTVPEGWSGCNARQCGKTLSCSLQNGTARYDARLGKGDVILEAVP